MPRIVVMCASRRPRSRLGLPRGADSRQTETGPSPAQAERPLAGNVKAKRSTAENGSPGKTRAPESGKTLERVPATLSKAEEMPEPHDERYYAKHWGINE